MSNSQRSFRLFVAVIYLLPILALLGVFFRFIPASERYMLVLLEVALTVGGLVLLMFLMRQREAHMKHAVSILVEGKVSALSTKLEKECFELQNDNKLLKEALENGMSFQDGSKGLSGGHLSEDLSAAIPPATPQVLTEAYQKIQGLQQLLAENNEKSSRLTEELDTKGAELVKQALEVSAFTQKVQSLEQGLTAAKDKGIEETKEREGILQKYQKVIEEQRIIIDKKQHYSAKLEAKIQDLSYEVRTLLQLDGTGRRSSSAEGSAHKELMGGDSPEDAAAALVGDTLEKELSYEMPVMPVEGDTFKQYDAVSQLRRLVHTAEEMTGAAHLGGRASRFTGLASDSYAIDLRRLFEVLSKETSLVLFVLSPAENKLVFANFQLRGLLGWSSDKFVKDFRELVYKSADDWGKVIDDLTRARESQANLLIRAKSGHEISLRCYLGIITSGAFKGYALGLLYPG